MDLQRYCIKLFLTKESTVNHPAVVELFHQWVKDQTLPGSLIDVADYVHVPNGPSTLLVGHEANIYIDDLEGQESLVYQSKAEQTGSLAERVAVSLNVAKQACDLLEKNSTLDMTFNKDMAHVISNDRLLLPNTDAGFAMLKDRLQSIGNVERVSNQAKERLTVRLGF